MFFDLEFRDVGGLFVCLDYVHITDLVSSLFFSSGLMFFVSKFKKSLAVLYTDFTVIRFLIFVFVVYYC